MERSGVTCKDAAESLMQGCVKESFIKEQIHTGSSVGLHLLGISVCIFFLCITTLYGSDGGSKH